MFRTTNKYCRCTLKTVGVDDRDISDHDGPGHNSGGCANDPAAARACR